MHLVFVFGRVRMTPCMGKVRPPVFGRVRMTPCMGKVRPPGAVCAGVLNVVVLPRLVCSLFITFCMKYAETECPVILIVECDKSHVTALTSVAEGMALW